MALRVKKKYPVPHHTRAHHTLPQRTMRREQRRASAKRFVSSIAILCLLVVAAGIGYTWYSGQHYQVAADQAAPVRSTRPIITPPKIASDAPIGSAIQTATSPVKRGQNASVSIRTNPAAQCTIAVRYNNVTAIDSGLVPKSSDEFGIASWAWTVPPDASVGKWPAEVTCKNKKFATVVKADIVVE